MPQSLSKTLYCRNGGHYLTVANGKLVQTETPKLYPTSKTKQEVEKENNITLPDNILLTEVRLETTVNYPNE
jgi:hypothetical protein